MNKITLLICLFVVIGNCVKAQYYYKDIVVTDDVIKQNQQFRKYKVSALNVKSYHYDNEEIDNFLCELVIENNAKHVLTITGSPFNGGNHLHSFFTPQGLVTRSVDSNATMIIQNNYEYNTANKLIKLSVVAFEPNLKALKNTDVHIWKYNAKGLPTSMTKIVNDKDTTVVQFTLDTVNNLVLDEVSYKKGVEYERYYYYYDSINRLTDVVRFHPYKKKFYPETILDYNDKNEVIRKTTWVPNTTHVTYWYYFYDPATGLKTEEQAYVKGNVFKGKLKYNYTYE